MRACPCIAAPYASDIFVSASMYLCVYKECVSAYEVRMTDSTYLQTTVTHWLRILYSLAVCITCVEGDAIIRKQT